MVTNDKISISDCDPYVKFEDPTFDDFKVIKTLTNLNLPMEWFLDLNIWQRGLLGIFLCWPQISCTIH